MFATLMASLLIGCSGEKPKEKPAPEPAPAPAPEPEKAKAPAPGKLPGVEFPVLTTTAQKGDFVLAPSRDFFDRAVEEGLDKATFIYYGAEMLEPGPAESKVKSLAGTEFMIPNSLIVAIPKAQTAAVGDLVVGHWESGSGLQRAIVVEGGTPEAPMVRYLDMDLSGDIGKKPDAWKADRFMHLEAGKVGVSVACKVESNVEHGVLVAATPKKVLRLGFAGRLSVHDTADCMPIDPAATFKAGDKVQFVFVSSYGEGEIVKAEPKLGRVTVKSSTGDKEYAAIDVAHALDSYGQGFVTEPVAPGEGKAGKGKAGEGEGEDGKAGKGAKGKGKAKGG
jgi:hypothetical protein